MAMPGNVTTVVVLGTFLTPEGNPSTGTITFTPSKWLTNSGADVAIPNSSITKTLGTAGNFTVTLPVTDDADLQPGNWFYTVSEVIDGVSQSYSILLPGTAGSNGTVYLADIAPAGELGPEYASLRGPAGEAATIAVGSTTSVANSGTASVTNVGTSAAGTFNFVLRDGPTGPTGATGPQGPQGNTGTFAVGSVSSVPNAGTAAVTNVGSSTAGTFDFVLRDGPAGPTGPQGPTATLTVGNITSVSNSGTASVTNVGSSSAGTFDFVLRDGPTGPQGATGTAATVTIGTIGFVDYPGPGTVTNSGTSGSAVLDFILVRGPQGAIGDLTASDPIAYVGSNFSLKYGAGLGTATGGTLVADFSDATPQALAAAGSAGSSTELARGDHAHPRPSAADIGALGTAALSSATPQALGVAAAGTSTDVTRADHTHAMPSASDVGAVANSLLTNKAALITATAASTPATLAVGTDGQVLKANSATSTGLEWGTDLGIPATLLDAKGDIIAATGDNTAARLAAGTNEHRLVADSAQATGLKYVADTTNYAIGAKGDLLVGTAADTVTNVAVGTNGHVLTADSTAASGVKWAAVSVAAPPNCRVKQSSSTSLTQNVGTVIAFQAEDFDTDTMHDNSTNNSRITIKTAGKYLVGASVQVNANSTIGARLRLNGSTFIGSTIVGNAGNPSAASVATIYDFAVNDYIEVLGLTFNASTSTSGDGDTSAFAIKVA
jgi:hypothetical protein